MWYFGSGILDAVDAVEVCIVDAGQEDMAAVSFNRDVLVQQHPDTHPFKIWHHSDGIMIPEDAVDLAADTLTLAEHTL